MQGDGDQVGEPQRPDAICFAGHTLDLANRELRRGDERLELGSRYFNALALLASQPGALIAKGRFMDEVWRGIPVTDEALTQCIRTLRRALGDEAGAPRFIETVPKHGYRFVAAVTSGVGPVARTGAPAPRSAGRLAGAATLGGGGAGFLGGLFYALAGAGAQSGPTALVLVALGSTLGVLGGAGVGLGMAGASAVWGRGVATLATGGAAGGMAVGALGQLLSLDGFALLTGTTLGAVTGLFEGAVLGGAAGLGAWTVLTSHRNARVAFAAIIGGAGGLLVAALGGRLLGGSLLQLETRFPGSRIAVTDLGRWFGEQGFGPVTGMATAALEAGAFVTGIALATTLLVRRKD